MTTARRQVYVAEFHPREFGDVWLRARCTICVPRWSGPLRQALALIGNGRAIDPDNVGAELRDLAVGDALRHADARHGGRLAP